MNRRRLTLLATAVMVGLSVFIYCFHSNHRGRQDLTLTFAGWTNIVRTNSPLRTWAAYGPCVLLAVTNINPSGQIEYFSAESMEALKDGRWIEVARATQSPWLIGGSEWPSGAGHLLPMRILGELPRESPWRVRVRYNFTLPKAFKVLDGWWRRLTPFDRSYFTPRDHFVWSSVLPPPEHRDMMDLSPLTMTTDLKEKEPNE